MSAEQYGSSLLEGVHQESFEQLLADVRYAINPPPKSVLGVPQLDAQLEAARYGNEPTTPHRPGWSPSRATGPEQAIKSDDGRDESHDEDDMATVISRSRRQLPNPKPAIIELTSRHSTSGKTNLVYYLTAISVLPLQLGGKQSAVVWIDNDGRFSSSRLLQIIQHYLHDRKPAREPLLEAEIESVALEALNHVHIFQPQSSTQVVSTLGSLPSYLLDSTRQKSFYRSLGLVIVDSATAFYWQDRFDAEMARLDAMEHKEEKAVLSRTTEIIAQLKILQARFECVVIFTTSAGGSVTSSRLAQNNLSSRSTIVPPTENAKVVTPWSAFATVTFRLQRTHIPQFAPQMSLEQCLHDADNRLEIVKNARMMVTVGSSSDGHGTAKKENAMSLRITAHGVLVDD